MKISVSVLVLSSLICLSVRAASVTFSVPLLTSSTALRAVPFSTAATAPHSVPFSIPTKDGRAFLTGQFDVPAAAVGKKLPIVIFVGGTGLFDRDYNYGNSGTEKDLLFKELSKQLVKVGIATARFDYRGIRCNEKTVSKCEICKTREEQLRHYVAQCIDNKVRATVTAGNIRDDVEAIYCLAQNQAFVDATKIVVFSHSEGTLHTSSLIEQKRIEPRGLLMMGFVAESASRIYHWQLVDRLTSAYWQMDRNQDRVITVEEIEEFCRLNRIAELQCTNLKPPASNSWTANTLGAYVEETYRKSKAEVMLHKNEEAFPYVYKEYGAVFASYGWWKMFFNETTDTYKWLLRYPGKISFNNGEIDGATPATAQLGLVEKNLRAFAGRVRLNTYPACGHSLGESTMVGPMKASSTSRLLQEIDWLLK